MNTLAKIVSALAISFAPATALAADHVVDEGAATEHDDTLSTRWNINLTPVLVLPKGEYRWGGGADPELRYTVDLHGAYLSAGVRVGAYYAKNLFATTAMPTMRFMVPVGRFEPYVSFGTGYGWIPRLGHTDFALMVRAGTVYRFSKKFAIGLEGTLQNIQGSEFSFPSVGSMMSFDL
jgi:hypothetical protein